MVKYVNGQPYVGTLDLEVQMDAVSEVIIAFDNINAKATFDASFEPYLEYFYSGFAH